MLTNGTDYQIDWLEFKPGCSFFIPAVDTKAASEAVKRESKRLKFSYVLKVVVEDGLKGVRVWRL
jgi:hypothetical protein